MESGTDYLDITGEPEFIERMEMDYHTKAVEAGCLMVSACGFDSIPAEIGVIFNSRQWKGMSAPNRINAYLELKSEKEGMVGNIGTLESAVLGMANSKNLQEFRRSRPRRAYPVVCHFFRHHNLSSLLYGVSVFSNDANELSLNIFSEFFSVILTLFSNLYVDSR